MGIAFYITSCTKQTKHYFCVIRQNPRDELAAAAAGWLVGWLVAAVAMANERFLFGNVIKIPSIHSSPALPLCTPIQIHSFLKH